MRTRLTEALHARPAALLVRLAQRFAATIEIRKETKRAIASRILEVLSLGAAAGDEVDVDATGADAEAALAAVRELIERGFVTDLVPETGSATVAGIAIGRAVVVTARDASEEAVAEIDRACVETAFVRAKDGLGALIASLAPREAALFEPERDILADLEARVLARFDAGEPALSAVLAETDIAPTDLILDARARLLDALAAGPDDPAARFAVLAEDAVLVTDALTPSLVASLPPRVAGIVAGADDADTRPVGFTSHAAILARGRGLPLTFVPPHVAAQISDGELVVVDTTTSPANVWASPSDVLVLYARERRETRAREHANASRLALSPLTHLGVAVRVNISSLEDPVPEAAEGVGLLRTELVFAGRRAAPSEAEQHAAASTLMARARGGYVVARLFDAGGDKPLSWLPPPTAHLGARGMDLLFFHHDILAAQVRALVRAGARILLPLVRAAHDVNEVRKLAGDGAQIGAMIETPEAARDADAIAQASDFVCIGTNDLSAALLGQPREIAALSTDPRLFDMVARVVERAHAMGRTVTVCGEIAGDPQGARALVGLGVDALSVSPSRLIETRRSLADATRDDCARALEKAMNGA